MAYPKTVYLIAPHSPEECGALLKAHTADGPGDTKQRLDGPDFYGSVSPQGFRLQLLRREGPLWQPQARLWPTATGRMRAAEGGTEIAVTLRYTGFLRAFLWYIDLLAAVLTVGALLALATRPVPGALWGLALPLLLAAHQLRCWRFGGALLQKRLCAALNAAPKGEELS